MEPFYHVCRAHYLSSNAPAFLPRAYSRYLKDKLQQRLRTLSNISHRFPALFPREDIIGGYVAERVGGNLNAILIGYDTKRRGNKNTVTGS